METILGHDIQLAALALPAELRDVLQSAGYNTLPQVADLTHERLMQLGLDDEQRTVFYCQLDFCYDKLTHYALLCAALPPICYDLDLAQLWLLQDSIAETDALAELLDASDYVTLSEVALAARADFLAVGWTPRQIDRLAFALTAFIDAYRSGELELIDEDEDFSSDYHSFQSEVDAEIDLLFAELESGVHD